MNFLNNRTFLRDLLKHGDMMNTVNGGVAETKFRVKNINNDLLIEISNPSISPKGFNFTIYKNELLVNIAPFYDTFGKEPASSHPIFFRAILIPYYVDINKIEVTFEYGVFKILLPYNNKLKKFPYKINVKNIDN